MRVLCWLVLAAVPLLNVPRAWADGGSISPPVADAIAQLSAGDFAAREKALANLQLAMAQELKAILETKDPETQARLGEVLQFERGLCLWASEVLRQPQQSQKDLFAFGLSPEVLPHVAHLYGESSAAKIDAIKSLSKVKDKRATDLIAKGLEDLNQPVYLAAMDAVWDREPTPAVVQALWYRAVQAQIDASKQQDVGPTPPIRFRGRQIQPIVNADNTLYQKSQDNALATDVLIQIKSPQVSARLKDFLAQVETVYARPAGPNNDLGPEFWMYMPSQEVMQNVSRLIDAYKPREIVPVLYRLATGPALQESQGQVQVGPVMPGRGRQRGPAQPYYWSNRTWAIAAVVELTGGKAADWNLSRMPQLSNMWIARAKADETQAIAKLRDWWAKEHEKYGGEPDTRQIPADTPAQPAGLPMPVDGPAIMPLIK